MDVIDKETCSNKDEVIYDEISNLTNLISRREKWLSNPKNKLKDTYNAVLQDTREMEEKLAELGKELDGIQNSTNK